MRQLDTMFEKLKPIRILILLTLFYFSSCNSSKKYTNEALDIIETNSIMRDSINWKEFRSNVLYTGKDDKSLEDAHSTIRYALTLLHDNHSFLLLDADRKAALSPTRKTPEIISEYIDEIGYIKIPGFTGSNSLSIEFARQLQTKVKELDSKNIKGWIIDLRNNTGGNMWPMLLGIGPILGEGIVGYFVDVKKDYWKWEYSNGQVWSGDNSILKLDSSFQLKNKNKKIAVLINNKTMSSGEAIAVAFKGVPNALFFGDNTNGLTTGNKGFLLSDSSMILLTGTIFADRNKKIYGKSLSPDVYELIQDPKKTAIVWINKD